MWPFDKKEEKVAHRTFDDDWLAEKLAKLGAAYTEIENRITRIELNQEVIKAHARRKITASEPENLNEPEGGLLRKSNVNLHK